MDLPHQWNRFKDQPSLGLPPGQACYPVVKSTCATWGTATSSSFKATRNLYSKTKRNKPVQRHLTVTKVSLPARTLLDSSCFQYCLNPTLQSSQKRWFGFENDADRTACWQLLQTCLHSKASTPLPIRSPRWRLNGIYLSRFSSYNYSFSFTMEHCKWESTWSYFLYLAAD